MKQLILYFINLKKLFDFKWLLIKKWNGEQTSTNKLSYKILIKEDGQNVIKMTNNGIFIGLQFGRQETCLILNQAFFI